MLMREYRKEKHIFDSKTYQVMKISLTKHTPVCVY